MRKKLPTEIKLHTGSQGICLFKKMIYIQACRRIDRLITNIFKYIRYNSFKNLLNDMYSLD